MKIKPFCKDANCPASHDLLAFQNGEVTAKENSFITKHLETCDFCVSEIKFYEKYPQADEDIISAEIPLHLLELAESLLSSKRQNVSLLNKLLTNKETANA